MQPGAAGPASLPTSPSCQVQNKPIGRRSVFANRGCEPCGPGLISLRRDWPSGWVSFRERTELNAKGSTPFLPGGCSSYALCRTKRSGRTNGSSVWRVSRILGCHDSAACIRSIINGHGAGTCRTILIDWHGLREVACDLSALNRAVCSHEAALIHTRVYQWVCVPEEVSPAVDPAPWIARPSFPARHAVNEKTLFV